MVLPVGQTQAIAADEPVGQDGRRPRPRRARPRARPRPARRRLAPARRRPRPAHARPPRARGARCARRPAHPARRAHPRRPPPPNSPGPPSASSRRGNRRPTARSRRRPPAKARPAQRPGADDAVGRTAATRPSRPMTTCQPNSAPDTALQGRRPAHHAPARAGGRRPAGAPPTHARLLSQRHALRPSRRLAAAGSPRALRVEAGTAGRRADAQRAGGATLQGRCAAPATARQRRLCVTSTPPRSATRRSPPGCPGSPRRTQSRRGQDGLTRLAGSGPARAPSGPARAPSGPARGPERPCPWTEAALTRSHLEHGRARGARCPRWMELPVALVHRPPRVLSPAQ